MPKKFKIVIGIFWIVIISGLITYLVTPKWTVYKNEELGFELSYPDSFISTEYKFNNKYNYILKDGERNITYLSLIIEVKPNDYKEPVGPFPVLISNEKYFKRTYPNKLNNIDGYKVEGGYEGGGGRIESFFFLYKNNLFNIDLNPTGQDLNSEYLYDKDRGQYLVNKKIYNIIKTSFKLI